MTQIEKEPAVIAVYETHESAEAAIKALRHAGTDMKRLSIIGKGFHTEEHAVGFYSAGERIKIWSGHGAAWGGLMGILFGSAFFFIPAIGPLVVLGPLVGWIVGALEVAAAGGAAGALAAALTSIGIPKDSVIKYESEVKAGRYLVIARGSAAIVEHARAVLGTTGASHVTAHAT